MFLRHMTCRSGMESMLSRSRLTRVATSLFRRSLVTIKNTDETILFSDALEAAQSLIGSKDCDRWASDDEDMKGF